MTTTMPGFVILRRPSAPATPDGLEEDFPEDVLSTTSQRAVCPPTTRHAGTVLAIWLEVVAGRRPMSVLNKGPYHSRILDFTDDLREQYGPHVMAHLKSLHIQEPISSAKGYRKEVRFCATILLADKVRALAGSFCLRRVAVPTPLQKVRIKRGSRRTDQWRLETLHLI